MSYSFNGLGQILRDSKINPDTMDREKFIVFINSSMTSFKVMIGPHHILYHSNGRKRFPLEAIQHFPEFFDGRKIDFSAAAAKVVRDKFK
jgi:hypothetical protein